MRRLQCSTCCSSSVRSRRLAGLRALGMTPLHLEEGQSFEEGQAANPGGAFTMVIFEDTCQQWTTAMQGAFSQSLTVATCYATLGEAAVIDIVNETAATTLMLNCSPLRAFSRVAHGLVSIQPGPGGATRWARAPWVYLFALDPPPLNPVIAAAASSLSGWPAIGESTFTPAVFPWLAGLGGAATAPGCGPAAPVFTTTFSLDCFFSRAFASTLVSAG